MYMSGNSRKFSLPPVCPGGTAAGIKIVCLLVAGLLLQSCASYNQRATSMRDGLTTGHPEVALSMAEEVDPENKDVLPSLDKGMLRRMTGDYKGSNRAFEAAKQEIDRLYGISVTENLASVTVNETMRSYVGDRYEQLLLHAYMAMNYIEMGDFDAARVEMLQADVKMKEWGDKPEDDPFLRYLEGIIYEALGEYDQALVSYRQAYTIYNGDTGRPYPPVPESLKKDLLRMLVKMGLRDEYRRYAKTFGMQNFKPDAMANNGDLVVILNNGLAPIRSETAVYLYSPEVQQNLRVAFPTYAGKAPPLRQPVIDVAGRQFSMETVENVDALARYSLEQAMPGIMARAMARAVVKYNTQKAAHDQGSLAGLLMTVTNIATERADTRSWSTLPQAIQLQRISLPAGEHKVRIEMRNAAGRTVDEIKDKVRIRPGKISFLIKHWNTPVPRLPKLKASK